MAADGTSNPRVALWRQSMSWACRSARCNHFDMDVADVDFARGHLSALDKNSTKVFQGGKRGRKEGCVRADARSKSEKNEKVEHYHDEEQQRY